MLSSCLGRIDDSQVGEPTAHKASVAGDERIGALQRVCTDEEGNAVLHQRNRFFPGEEVELLMPGSEPVTFTAPEMTDSEGLPVEAARHADMELHMKLPVIAPEGSFLRKRREA